MIHMHANGLLATLILAGRIPGADPHLIVEAARRQERTGLPSRVRIPVVYCQGERGGEPCASQLVTDWYAIDPVTDLQLMCLWCARVAKDAGAEVWTLIGRSLP